MRNRMEVQLKVGLFVVIGLVMTMASVILLGGSGNFFSKTYQYSSHFANVDGLIPGAKVILSGVNVGTVDSVAFDEKKRNIVVHYSVNKEALNWIRSDSVAEIATQGVLGDKFISIKAGTDSQPLLPVGSDLEVLDSKDIAQFISNGDQLLVSLNRIAKNLDRMLSTFEADGRSESFFKNVTTLSKNLSQFSQKLDTQMDGIQIKKAVGHLHDILEKMNHGNGTFSSLLNDPSLYDEMRALVGGANRNRVIRNLIRQTIKNSETPKEGKGSKD